MYRGRGGGVSAVGLQADLFVWLLGNLVNDVSSLSAPQPAPAPRAVGGVSCRLSDEMTFDFDSDVDFDFQLKRSTIKIVL